MTGLDAGAALLVAGGTLAFAAATAATFLDCYFTLQKSLPRVPGLILFHPGVLTLSAVCGLVAVIAFAVTDPAGADVVSTTITLKQANPIWRGLAVGTTVLVLIRSKLFNLQDRGVGGEVVYTFLQSLAMQSVNDTRVRRSTAFLDANIGAAFSIPTYFAQLETIITSAMRVRPPELRQRAAEELKAVKTNLPSTPMTQTDAAWSTYYYAMTGICYDYCGPMVLENLSGFRIP